MRVSPKYIIQLCQREQNQIAQKCRTNIRERQKKYCMYSRYTSCKRVPKKRTKKRQTQFKGQGSNETSRIKLETVETSRIKLEIVETSRIKLEINEAFSISDRETTQKGTTTTTSGTSPRKGIITKGKKTGKRSEEYSDTTNTTSRTSRAPSDNKCIKIHAKQNSLARRVRPSKLVITIAQIKHRYTNETLEIRYYGVKSATREISRNDRRLPKIQEK